MDIVDFSPPMADVIAEMNKESEPISNSRFIDGIIKDHPEVKDQLIQKLPEWKKSLDTFMGMDGFSDIVLEEADYISKEETVTFIKGVADEVKQILEERPDKDIYFIRYTDNARSEEYFYRHVTKSIPEDKRDKVKLVNPTQLTDLTYDGVQLGDVFFCDDSANSGQQMRTSLIPLVSYSRREFDEDVKPNGEPVRAHVRLLRVTDDAMEKLDIVKGLLRDTNPVEIDLKTGGKMKSMNDVADRVEKEYPDKKYTAEQRSVTLSHHQYGVGTLGVFYHRLQDNLTPIFISGRISEGLAKHGVTPLLDESVFIPYPPLFS